MDDQSGESKEEEVMGEGISESEMEELMVPEWGWRVDSRDKVKHSERSDQFKSSIISIPILFVSGY